MDIIDDENLGTLVDEQTSDEDQSDLNQKLLMTHDCNDLLDSLSKKISSSKLNFLIENIFKHVDMEYWKKALNIIIKKYSLSPLRNYVDNIFWLDDPTERNYSTLFSREVVKLIIYIKIKLINDIESLALSLKNDITYEELYDHLKQDNAPVMLLICIKYIDKTSLTRFINTINIEAFDSAE